MGRINLRECWGIFPCLLLPSCPILESTTGLAVWLVMPSNLKTDVTIPTDRFSLTQGYQNKEYVETTEWFFTVVYELSHGLWERLSSQNLKGTTLHSLLSCVLDANISKKTGKAGGEAREH